MASPEAIEEEKNTKGNSSPRLPILRLILQRETASATAEEEEEEEEEDQSREEEEKSFTPHSRLTIHLRCLRSLPLPSPPTLQDAESLLFFHAHPRPHALTPPSSNPTPIAPRHSTHANPPLYTASTHAPAYTSAPGPQDARIQDHDGLLLLARAGSVVEREGRRVARVEKKAQEPRMAWEKRKRENEMPVRVHTEPHGGVQ